MLVEPAAHGSCFLGPQIQGLVFLALGEMQGECEDQGLGATGVAKEATEPGTKVLKDSGKTLEVEEGGKRLGWGSQFVDLSVRSCMTSSPEGTITHTDRLRWQCTLITSSFNFPQIKVGRLSP